MRNRKTVEGIACALALAAVLGGCTPELVFSPATLPDGQVGAPYAATITVSQVETPVDDVVQGGALPPGSGSQMGQADTQHVPIVLRDSYLGNAHRRRHVQFQYRGGLPRPGRRRADR